MQLVDHHFGPRDFVAGHAALDLANTVAGRDPERRASSRANAPGRDRLPDYDAVLAWSAAMPDAVDGVAPILSLDEIETLTRLARRERTRAAEALDALKEFREATFATFAAIARGIEPPAAALTSLRDAWHGAAAASRLERAGDGFALVWSTRDSALELPLHRAAWSAMELLTAGDHARLRLCAGDDCAWLFLDQSKPGRRRWCDMATCGNVAKARRHYARQRGG